MPLQRTSDTRAFTLVEILIVVVILGILAAIVVPQFAASSDDAKETSLVSTIKVLREQISLYKLQHDANGPHVGPEPADITGLVLTRRLTERTEITGKLDTNGPYGPYLIAWSANPFSDGSTAYAIQIGILATPPRTGATGWYYNSNTCIISANSTTGGESSDP